MPRHLRRSPDGAEITLEANPETSTRERLERFRAAGVNRLSFGVQSFREPSCGGSAGCTRPTAPARPSARRAAAGFDNVSLDLMMWLPQQSRDDWRESVEALIDVGPEHASLYLLELYPNAPLKEEMARSGWSLAPDDDAAEMYLWSLERLERAGYRQVPDLERRAAGPGVAPQPQVLDRTASGSDSAAAPTRRSAGCGGGTWPRPRNTSRGSATGEPAVAERRELTATSVWRRRCSPGCG